MSEGRARAGVRIRESVGERVSTPLELLFDLCFVVAVAILATDLHHGIVERHAADAVRAYALLFVPVWWAWMSFTWYATAFDNDDAINRILSMLQMVGIVALAATVHDAANGDLGHFGYAVAAIRAPLVVQWARAARSDVPHRRFAATYAAGLSVGAVVWILGTRLETPGALAVLAPALLVDLVTPVLAVKQAPGPIFHPGHIAERFGLFALIVIGESILAISVGLERTIDGTSDTAQTLAVVASGIAIAFGTWWIYFDGLGRNGLSRHRRAAFVWGYGHYLLYAAIAAIGAGIQAQLDLLEEGSGAAAAVSLPAALALLAVGLLELTANRRGRTAVPLVVGGTCCLVAGLAGTVAADLVAAAVVLAAAATITRSGAPTE